MMQRYINPYTDYGFKKLFGTEENKELLVSFLNAMTFDEEGIITDVVYKNVEQLADIKDREMGRYEDPKYVKAAGNYLWSGVLIALEAVFQVEAAKKKRKGEDRRVSVDDYIAAASKRDRKLLGWITDGGVKIAPIIIITCFSFYKILSLQPNRN